MPQIYYKFEYTPNRKDLMPRRLCHWRWDVIHRGL